MVPVNGIIVAAALVNKVEGLKIIGEHIFDGAKGGDSLSVLIFAAEPLFLGCVILQPCVWREQD